MILPQIASNLEALNLGLGYGGVLHGDSSFSQQAQYVPLKQDGLFQYEVLKRLLSLLRLQLRVPYFKGVKLELLRMP